MRLLICAGGTGGGVYPALAVLQSLESAYKSTKEIMDDVHAGANRDRSELQVLWVGTEDGMEQDLMLRSNIQFEAIPAAGVHGVGWRKLPGNLRLLVNGYSKSKTIISRFHPDVLFFTGGYVAVPMALAGRKVPSLLYIPDIEPGLALKTLAYFADRLAVTVDRSRRFLPRWKEVTVTGYPARADLRKWNLADAREAFSLQPGLPTLLVFGGSRGARSINRALYAALPDLLEEMQVIHITGQLDWEENNGFRKELPNLTGEPMWAQRYHAFPYLHEEMGAALTVADLVVSRAGASTLGEFPLFELPAILVPYPYAWRYQKTNAKFLEERGASVIIYDEALPKRLSAVVLELIHDRERRQRMRRAMRDLAQPSAADSISMLLHQLAGGSSLDGGITQ